MLDAVVVAKPLSSPYPGAMMQAMRRGSVAEYAATKRRARGWVARMVRRGALDRPAACACGARAVHAHHPDYARPFRVEWVCAACHARLHRPTDPGQMTLWLGA